MSDPTTNPQQAINRDPAGYCKRCDDLVGLDAMHVLSVHDRDEYREITVESDPTPRACPDCHGPGAAHGRVPVTLVDIPSFGRPVRICWLKRRYTCPAPGCARTTFVEHNPTVALPRQRITVRVVAWALEQLRREHATINSLARQLSTAWSTVWKPVKAALEALAADPTRFDGVSALGVDEHIWHHTCRSKRGPKEFTGMVDLSRDDHGKVKARLVDLVPGRSASVLAGWLRQRGEGFRSRVDIAALDPFAGYKRAIDDTLDDATAVLDAFHVVKLAVTAVDDVRRRLWQHITGYRGRSGDPLYGIRTIVRCDPRRLTERQWQRFDAAIAADPRHEELFIAWQAAHALRAAYHEPDMAAGRRAACEALRSLPSCPIPEMARLGRTLRRWKDAFLAYWDTARSNNGGTEAINGLIELHRRLARGFRNRDNYRLRMLLIAGGLRL
ncbi:ISL3 family transposase [Corynebacterium uterequi]|uniref:Transposase family protein n=1 Tax=Corynebacterium uterequi TaxID=1072256 RepID=A0A0G3HGA6_9CORY|nr:ISL3 family transposase [Corynebacterium uterequi]AKK10983.1 transposase family protein [Corynebacterium uterequi]